MTTQEPNDQNAVAQLDTDQRTKPSRGYWSDAWSRLRRNRLALVGLVIILINVFLAIFAPVFAVEGIDDQNTEEADAASAWIMNLFPSLEPRDEEFDVDGGEVLVSMGDEVNANDLLISFDALSIITPVTGTAFVDERRLYVFVGEVPTIEAGNGLQVETFDSVDAGETLFGDTTAQISGTVFIVEGQILILPDLDFRKSGFEVLVEHGQTVAVGDALLRNEESGDEILAPYAGTVFETRNNIELALHAVERIALPEGAEVEIRDGREVLAGDVLFGETTAPISGDAFVTDTEIIIRPPTSWLISDLLPSVTTGQAVEAGEALLDFSSRNVFANMDGTVFINEETVILSPLEAARFDLPTSDELEVSDQQPITEGTTLFGNTISPVAGVVFIDEANGELLVRPQNAGYAPLRNEYPLGADYLGRDVWSRLLYGARVSLLVALIGPLTSFIIGVPYGLVSGYFAGRLDNWMMRFVDLMYAFPTLLLIILLMAFFRSSAAATQQGTFAFQMGEIDRATGGMFFIAVGIGLTSWMGLARLTRGQVLSVREQEYLIAAKALGQSTPKIMRLHVLPNVLGPIIISETLTIPTYIRYEAFLSFIGLGVNAPTPSWGVMISDGAAVLRNYPHEAIFPALALFLIMFAFNFLGDGLRDALDPRMRGID